MASEVVIPPLAAYVADLVKTVMGDLRPRLIESALSGEWGENRNDRHKDNFLSSHDLWMHQRYLELLTQELDSFVYASEEADPQVVGADPDPDLCVLVDPLDTSELAVRGLLGYTHIMVYSRRLARPIVAVIGDIYHHVQLYVAARNSDGEDQAFAVTADSAVHRLRVRASKSLSEALVTNYLMRPEDRFVPLAQQQRFLNELAKTAEGEQSRGRIGVDFGSVGLCHVATGFTDAMIEFAKGFAIWDLAPGHYVLHAAGGVVIDLDGRPVSLDYELKSLADITAAMDVRQKFIAAGSPELADEIRQSLDQ